MLSLFGINTNPLIDPTMWYIPFIFIWYVTFYMVFNKVKSNLLRILSLLIIAIVLVPFATSDLWNKGVGVVLYIFYFPVGVVLAIFSKSISVINKRYIKYICLVIIAVSSFIIIKTYGRVNNTITYFINIAAVSCAIILVFFLTEIKSRFFYCLGKISYEIYLIEFIFIVKYNFIFKNIQNRFLSVSYYLVLIIVFSLSMKKVFYSLLRSIYGKVKKHQNRTGGKLWKR